MTKLNIIAVIGISLIFIASTIDLNTLFNYTDQGTPTYISNDNTPADNMITDSGATLGRVLFYDKNLSINNTVSCSSCHHQEFAFSDTSVVSSGVNGVTGRHSMRLINARYSLETKAFWDERADSFEDQATQPIQDHVEMGFSGEFGDPGIDSLILKMNNIEYYTVLFDFVFGDSEITEDRIQKALAQFVRSIESYDSDFDEGRAMVSSINSDFPNYSDLENTGKTLFFTPPPMGGAGCFRCHGGEEFSITNNSDNNGVIGVANDADAIDLENTKAPTLRDLVNPQGEDNGQFMHDGSLSSLMDVVNHYNDLEEVAENTNLDFRLAGPMHDLNLTNNEKDALVAFLLTLTGDEVYTAEKWSNPFDDQDEITVIAADPDGILELGNSFEMKAYPNPTSDYLNISINNGSYQVVVFDNNGLIVQQIEIKNDHTLDLRNLANGVYVVQVTEVSTAKSVSRRIVKK